MRRDTFLRIVSLPWNTGPKSTFGRQACQNVRFDNAKMLKGLHGRSGRCLRENKEDQVTLLGPPFSTNRWSYDLLRCSMGGVFGNQMEYRRTLTSKAPASDLLKGLGASKGLGGVARKCSGLVKRVVRPSLEILNEGPSSSNPHVRWIREQSSSESWNWEARQHSWTPHHDSKWIKIRENPLQIYNRTQNVSLIEWK